MLSRFYTHINTEILACIFAFGLSESLYFSLIEYIVFNGVKL